MKTKIYIVTYVNFDGLDDNLYSNAGVFTDETEARKAFDRECQTALAYAKFEDGCSDHEGTYEVNEEKNDIEYSVSRSGSTYYTTVKLATQEISVRYPQQARCKVGDKIRFIIDGETKPHTATVERVDVLIENDIDGSPIDNSCYKVRYRRGGQNLPNVVYESELTHINGQPVNYK